MALHVYATSTFASTLASTLWSVFSTGNCTIAVLPSNSSASKLWFLRRTRTKGRKAAIRQCRRNWYAVMISWLSTLSAMCVKKWQFKKDSVSAKIVQKVSGESFLDPTVIRSAPLPHPISRAKALRKRWGPRGGFGRPVDFLCRIGSSISL